MKWNLLEKTTFWVEGIDLCKVNLEDLAREAALALGLGSQDVMVVDVRPGIVVFDLLKREVQVQSIVGREKELLKRLGTVPGVSLDPEAKVHSEGILGLIALNEKEAESFLSCASSMASEILKNVSLRVLVFASGSEIISGKIQDTNSPYLKAILESLGFKVKLGGVLEDDIDAVVAKLEEGVEKGYGLIITTGGVGAEDKDCNIEAILRLDPNAHTPWILKFKPDSKRHHKDGVRIAVGRLGITRLIALPGPHEEVKIACQALIEGLRNNVDDASLAQKIADVLRKRWQERVSKEVGKSEL